MLEFVKRGYYVPKLEIINFSRSLPWDQENAKRSLREILKNTWFGDLVIKKFELKASYPESELVNSLGRESGALDDQATSLKRLIELLEYSEIIQKNESDEYVLSYTDLVKPVPLKEVPIADIKEKQAEIRPNLSNEKLSSKISYQINLNVSVPEEINDKYIENLEQLLDRIKRFIKSEAEE